MHARFLEWRGVETPCAKCDGSGVASYANTSGWRRGIGGCAVTQDVCDVCWGTGDARRKGLDLRAQREGEDARGVERAARLFATRVGASWPAMHPSLEELARELERLSRGRRPRTRWFYQSCESLAKLLREMVATHAKGAP